MMFLFDLLSLIYRGSKPHGKIFFFTKSEEITNIKQSMLVFIKTAFPMYLYLYQIYSF